MGHRFLFYFLSACIVTGCSVSKYNADKKYSPQQLQDDYSLMRNILEKEHPSLYWYTPKDSMDYYFDAGYKKITDSMTELQFGWSVLAPVISKIHCGHTGFSMSKGWDRFIRNKRIPSFPLYIKLCRDTMTITGNLNRKDSVLKRGTVITGINGIRSGPLIKKMFDYLSEDGYADNVNYVRVSSNFPYFHRNIFGLYKNYSVGYLDSTGNERKMIVPLFVPIVDTTKKVRPPVPANKPDRPTRKERLSFIRSMQVDTPSNTALITLNSFSKGHLKNFYHTSFKTIRKQKVSNVIIDLRNNGGGEINNYTALSKYIRTTKFKVCDTAVAVTKGFGPYTKYIHAGFWNNLGLFFLTKKHADNLYHFSYWENHTFRPRRKSHFNGKVFVITNGLTFSASSLFCNSVKGQPNVTLVGEETGGGWYGNSGIMIPDITLPNTKLRVRLPVFKLVQYNHISTKGTGVLPDINVYPSVADVKNNADRKMEVIKEMIRSGK